MTVKELIEELRDSPPEAKVCFETGKFPHIQDLMPVTEVIEDNSGDEALVILS